MAAAVLLALIVFQTSATDTDLALWREFIRLVQHGDFPLEQECEFRFTRK